MTPAVTELDAAGVDYTLHEYDHDPSHGGFGAEAAAALGLDPDEVFKTLVVDVDGEPVVAIVPVSAKVSFKAVARAVGGRKARMCDPAVAERLTGYVRGGISPFGQRRRLPTVVDETALLVDVMYVSGGKRGLDVGIAPGDLLGLLTATVAAVAAP